MVAKHRDDGGDPFANSGRGSTWSGTAQPPPPGPPLPPGSPGIPAPPYYAPPPPPVPPSLGYPPPGAGYPPPGAGYPSSGAPVYPPPYGSVAGGASSAKNWMGIVSLVLGCLGGGVLGIIFGHLGLAASKKGEANNRGVALAGLLINYFVVGVLAIAAVSFGILGLLASTSGSHSAQTSGDPTPAQSPAGSDLVDFSRSLDTNIATAPSWYDLSVGQCITTFWSDGLNADSTFVTPDVVPCSEPHYGEVYALARVGGETSPGDATVNYEITRVCEGQAFAAYVGVTSYDQSGLYYDALYPDEAFWNDGNHDMVCVVVEKGLSTTGSLRGSGL